MDWNYIAGFIDGEGSMWITNSHKHGKGGVVRISISNTNKEVLEEIQKFIGYGTLKTFNRNPGVWKRQYELRITHHKKCLFVLQHIKNIAIVKRKKCNELIEFITKKRWVDDMISKEELSKYDGKPIREVAPLLGVNSTTVWRYRQKYGLKGCFSIQKSLVGRKKAL